VHIISCIFRYGGKSDFTSENREGSNPNTLTFDHSLPKGDHFKHEIRHFVSYTGA